MYPFQAMSLLRSRSLQYNSTLKPDSRNDPSLESEMVNETDFC